MNNNSEDNNNLVITGNCDIENYQLIDSFIIQSPLDTYWSKYKLY